MCRVFGWLTLMVLCCAAGGEAGEETPDARRVEAQAAFDEATKLQEAGRYSEALARAQQALAIQEAALGDTHPDVAQSLNRVARLFMAQGLFSRAEPLHQRALAIQEAALGDKHPDVAQTLHYLALVYRSQELYGRAEQLFLRALTLREATLVPEPLDVAQTLQSLAVLYASQGAKGRAEQLLLRVLAIREEALGGSHPLVAQSLDDLAYFYSNQGLYARVESLLQRELAIIEGAHGKRHPLTARVLFAFAWLYAEQGLYARAEPLFQRALAIQEAALGKSHPELANVLYGLACLYVNQGQYARAELLLQRELAIEKATFGENHYYFADALKDLGDLYANQGQYARAEPFYERALAIEEAELGRGHPLVVTLVNYLAMLRLGQNRLDEALALYTRTFARSEQRLRQEALDFSESRLSGFLQRLRANEQALYVLLRAYPEDARVRRLALSAALLRKGRSIEETADISRTLYRGLGAEDRDTFERLRGLRTRLATLSLEGPGPLTPRAHQQRLQSLADEGDALEADLARRSAPLRMLTSLPPPEEIVGRVAAALPRDSVLVEFVAYAESPLALKPQMPARVSSSSPGPLRYLAVVLFPDGSTRAVDLGAAEPIDRAASRLRNALANRDASFQGTAQELYQRVFQPLLPLLGSTRRLFVSPDGQLGLVPFAALHDGQGFLVDSFDFIYLTSGRQLLPRPQDDPPASSVFVLADPDFSTVPPAPRSTSGSTPLLADDSEALERFSSTVRTELAASTWVPLPGSRQEAEGIQRLLPQARLFLGPEATKERLLHLSRPGILHVATHGFFLEDAPTSEGSRGVGHFGALGDNPQSPPPPEPLLRSGLALAGASVPSRSRPDVALVTALELAGLDLWGTQLVVLSACDTGRGEVQLGQGVQGLRRSLVVAGAETVVMSLWKVSDESTRLLMEGYYRNLLAGQGRASALREAMRALRASRPHPHDWAPFIALGSDEPLRAILPNEAAGGRSGPGAAPAPILRGRRASTSSPPSKWDEPAREKMMH